MCVCDICQVCRIIKHFSLNPVFSKLSLGSIFNLVSDYLLYTYLEKEYFVLPQPKRQRS